MNYFFSFFLSLFSLGMMAQFSVDITNISYPNKMNPSNNYQVYATIKNTGEQELNRSNCTLEVVYISGPDKSAGEDFEYSHDLISGVTTNKEYTFRWSIKSPTVPGTYKLKLNIKNGSSILTSEDLSVLIDENFEAEISNNIDGIKFEPEKKYPPISITIKNNGETTWPDGDYKIIAEVTDAPDEASDEEKSAFEFDKNIDLQNLQPGASKSVASSSFDTPSNGGNYELKVSIQKDGKFFNAKNAEITIDCDVKEESFEVDFSENVTTKIYPEKEYPVSFTVKNKGNIKWPEGDFSIKATLTSKASSNVDDDVFEAEVDFNAEEWSPGDYTTIKFPAIITPLEAGRYTVKYQILVNNKLFETDDSELTIDYQVVELEPELNVNRITLEKKMVSGKTYKLRVDVKNNGDIIGFENDWVVKCKIRSKKPSNYRPPRGTFDFSINGIDVKSKETKYITGSIKSPKVEEETTIRLELEVYYKGKRMGGPKTYDIIIKP